MCAHTYGTQVDSDRGGGEGGGGRADVVLSKPEDIAFVEVSGSGRGRGCM